MVDEDPDIASWSEVIEDVLHLVPTEKRAAVIVDVSAKLERKQRERKTNPFDAVSLADLDDMSTLGMRHWNRVMRLKSRVIFTFVRDIASDHSSEEAARILYQEHAGVGGSGRLLDYLPKG